MFILCQYNIFSAVITPTSQSQLATLFNVPRETLNDYFYQIWGLCSPFTFFR
ncbi:MAG: hypothetical protein KAG28_00405 [Cocleimonas sp.]|nr:hypothetical protein [Cocleimonas sp.]